MGIPTLELHPGTGLGPFFLGNPICDALAEVETQQSLSESIIIKYSEQDPLSWDIVMAFPHLGFHLCFDPRSQRLYKIEVYDVTRVHLRYAGSIIGGPSMPATFQRIYSSLGPTFPGAYNSEKAAYTLSYPGISLLFPLAPRYAACCLQSKELPFEFPDGTTPVVTRIIVHLRDALPGTSREASIEKLPQLLLPSGSLYMEEVHVRLGQSIQFSSGRQQVEFGASAQDVWSELGRPCDIIQRQAGTMLIHQPSMRPGQPPPGVDDVAWSYFTRGLDIVFDARTHTVKKFVLHTNVPGNADFNEYLKCNFVIKPPSEKGQDRVTADSTWDHVQRVLGDGGSAAIQTVGSLRIAFGPTFVYGLPDATFEVMRNGHICTVTLFQSSSCF